MAPSLDVYHIAHLAQNLQRPPPDSEPLDSDQLSSGPKRKADDPAGSPVQQRARRNRYVSIACNECKRRKIKCNGQMPCQRCGNLTLECVYAPNCCTGFKESQEFKDMSSQITLLQDQVNTLYEQFDQLRAQLIATGASTSPQSVRQQQQTPLDPALQSLSSHISSSASGLLSPGAAAAAIAPRGARLRTSSQSQNRFTGPTSSAFNLRVAQSSLVTMGITRGDEETSEGGEVATESVEMTPRRTPVSRNENQLFQRIHAEKDPIWTIPKEEVLRLCRVYEDEMGEMYPVLDVNKVIDYAVKLYQFMEAAQRSGLMQYGMPGSDTMDDEDTNILKLVLATAMTMEASGRSELGKRIFEYVQPAIDTMLLGTVGVKAIRLLSMTAMYEFHRDNEGTSWRIIGLTARLCIELGLHRKEVYDSISDEAERAETALLFWSIYVLDRRWSFGTGMPFALQDSDIDPQLPKPEDRWSYLNAMIQYSGLASKVWRSVATSMPPRTRELVNVDEMNYLDYQVIQWHRNVPAQLRFEHPSQHGKVTMPIGPECSRAGNRLRILLYLRANQMRILIYRPVLQSATSIMQHREQAQTAVAVAQDSIRVLTHVNQTSDLYSTQQVLFNAFLTSALVVLFLAVSHTPAIFCQDVREEFCMALELVRGLNRGSWVSKRLWKTIRIMKEVGPKLGLLAKELAAGEGLSSSSPDDPDPNRTAAVAMAGLAGVKVNEMSLYNAAPSPPPWPTQPSATSSSEEMVHELTSLFEAAGGYQGVDQEFARAAVVRDGAEGFGKKCLSNILTELF